MQGGVILATVMVLLLTLLTPETPYWHEAIIMTLLGFGLGFVMPVMNVAVQNEFKQSELGVATSSIQLFRGLGSTIGIAIFGALLTSGIATNLQVNDDAYIQSLRQSSAVQEIGDLDDPNTQLTLNTPDVKEQIATAFNATTARMPEAQREAATTAFNESQAEYSNKVTHAFSDSLRVIFISSAVMLFAASVLVLLVREKPLTSVSSASTPGEM